MRVANDSDHHARILLDGAFPTLPLRKILCRDPEPMPRVEHLTEFKSMYDAILIISFGGPEKPDDVLPFLENVLRGKPVPHERLLEVAEHYYQFDGRSPINNQNRALIAALEPELRSHGIDLPIYWGNRNWNPLITDTLAQMKG